MYQVTLPDRAVIELELGALRAWYLRGKVGDESPARQSGEKEWRPLRAILEEVGTGLDIDIDITRRYLPAYRVAHEAVLAGKILKWTALVASIAYLVIGMLILSAGNASIAQSGSFHVQGQSSLVMKVGLYGMLTGALKVGALLYAASLAASLAGQFLRLQTDNVSLASQAEKRARRQQ